MDFTLGRLRQPHQRVGQLCLTIATHACDAVNLPGVQGQVDAVERTAADAAQLLDLQTHLTGCRRLMLGNRHRFAHRQLHQLLDADTLRIKGLYRAPAAHDRYPVGIAFDVSHLVRNQNHRRTLPGECLNGQQQTLGFLIGQHCRRLVEDQNPRTGQQHLENLDALLLGDRQAVDGARRVNRKTQRLGLADNFLFQRTQPLAIAAFTGLLGQCQENVLRHRERFHQLEVLVNHADPVAAGVPRALKLNRIVVQQQGAGFRCIQPGGDVHQRGLACTVLAQQRVHFPPTGGEVGVDQRLEAIERFADAGELQRIDLTHC